MFDTNCSAIICHHVLIVITACNRRLKALLCDCHAKKAAFFKGPGAAFFKMLPLDGCDAINYKFILIISYLYLFVPNCNWYTPQLPGIYEI